MRNAILGLAVGIGALAAIGGSAGGATAQEPDADYSGIGDVVDFSGLDGLENLAPSPVEWRVAAKPPAATVEEPAPVEVVAEPVPIAPVATGVVGLPATGDGGETDAESAARLLLYAAGLVVMGTLILAAAKRRA